MKLNANGTQTVSTVMASIAMAIGCIVAGAGGAIGIGEASVGSGFVGLIGLVVGGTGGVWWHRSIAVDVKRRAFDARDMAWAQKYDADMRALEEEIARLKTFHEPPTHEGIDLHLQVLVNGLNTLAHTAAELIDQGRVLRVGLGTFAVATDRDQHELGDLRARAADSARAAAILAGAGRAQNDSYAPRVKSEAPGAPPLPVAMDQRGKGELGLRIMEEVFAADVDTKS